jgi:F-type H+-transporting ATPase subunit delta
MSLGQEDGNFERYGTDLQEFTAFCRKYQAFKEAIANRVFPTEERKGVLHAVLEKSDISDMVKKFLNLLLDKNRIGAIEGITNYYDKLSDDISNIARAEITAPKPLKKETQDRLEKVLEDFTSKAIRIEVKEDESLIGGVIVKIGDMVLDGSVKAQLDGLKESLKRGEYS